MINSLLLDGQVPGPKIAIFGGIHGNETCVVQVVNELITEFQANSGSLLLAYGNIDAIASNARQIDYNLNRLFDKKLILYQRL